MKNSNEERFKGILADIVQNEPEKLAFFSGSGADATPPAFIPANPVADPKKPDRLVRRKRAAISLFAAAACLVVISVAAIGQGLPGANGGLAPGQDPQGEWKVGEDGHGVVVPALPDHEGNDAENPAPDINGTEGPAPDANDAETKAAPFSPWAMAGFVLSAVLAVVATLLLAKQRKPE
jgi:hypothetical protein